MATKFRTSFTSVEGAEAAQILQGRVVNVNVVKWTVDVVMQFDRKRYFQVQVGSPYQHPSNGEGMYVVPEVGATCMVCIPSDSAPPFVLSFVMPSQTVNDSSPDAPMGTESHGQQVAHPTDASFAGNRPQVKPGDIVMRTRDSNFVVLHRGGVLQIGATELAQRIFIPLRNLVTDISENYEHHNSNGSVVWGLQDGSTAQLPSQYMHTFRVFASDKYADVKVAVGKVYNPIPEPDGGAGMAAAEIEKDDDKKGSNPIICEVTVSPKGFVAETGYVADKNSAANSVFKFVFDRKGNTYLRTEGNFYAQVKKKLTFKVTEAIAIQTDDAVLLKAKNGIDLVGGAYTHVKGDVVRLGQGTTPVARQGDMVKLEIGGAVPVPINITVASPLATPGATTIGTLTIGLPGAALPLFGSIISGNSTVLA